MKKAINIIQAFGWVLIIIGLISLILSLSSCRVYNQKILDKYCPKQSKVDSFKIYETRVDSFYTIDSVWIVEGGEVEYDFSPCDSLTNKLKVFEQRFKVGNNTTIIKSDGKSIKVSSECEDEVNRLKLQLSSLKASKDTLHTSKEIIRVEPIYSLWMRFKMSLFGSALIYIGIGVIIFELIKIYLKRL